MADRAWRETDLANAYDVVILGAGVQGLATAYYLATQFGITKIAVICRREVGEGGSGPNSAVVRSDYLDSAAIDLYGRSLELFKQMNSELKLNVGLKERGHLTVAHGEKSLHRLKRRSELGRLNNWKSEVVVPKTAKAMVEALDVSPNSRSPITGALHHAAGSTIRPDSVCWSYARAADALGVEIHSNTAVHDIVVTGGQLPGGKGAGGRVTGLKTNRGNLTCPVVINCLPHGAGRASEMVGVQLPLASRPAQMAVTEPVKHLLSKVVISEFLGVWISPTDDGELLLGQLADSMVSYTSRGTLVGAESLATQVLKLMPGLSQVRILQQWSAVKDITPDNAPVIGATSVGGYALNVGWSGIGLGPAPAVAELLATFVDSGRKQDLLAPFGIERFGRSELSADQALVAG